MTLIQGVSRSDQSVIGFLDLQKVDWEAELAVVIGKRCKGASNDEVEDCIFGYTVAQDISARDWQKTKRNGGQWVLSKAMDTFCPLGPAVITKEAVADINNLFVRSWVNGKQKQDGNTSELIFKPQEIIAYISQFVSSYNHTPMTQLRIRIITDVKHFRFFTLLPGDVILTGTPAGVGYTRNPPEFLQVCSYIE